jgi:hypothetical protein
MPGLPPREQQICQSHARLIHQVVKACQNEAARAELQPMLAIAEQNGWGQLVEAIRRILAGQRDIAGFGMLDEEDQIIVHAILAGLQNPASLPDPAQPPQAASAAPGLALMIHAASQGDTDALQAAAFMAEQMTATRGDMRILGGQIRRLIAGERDPDVLSKGMSSSGRQLILDLLDELGQLAVH